VNEQEFREALWGARREYDRGETVIEKACRLFREAMEVRDAEIQRVIKELANYKRHFCGAHQWSVEARPLEVEAVGDVCLVCSGAEAREAKDRRIAELEALADANTRALAVQHDDLDRVARERDESLEAQGALILNHKKLEREASSLREELAGHKSKIGVLEEERRLLGEQLVEAEKERDAYRESHGAVVCELSELKEQEASRLADLHATWKDNLTLRAKLEAAEGALREILKLVTDKPYYMSHSEVEAIARAALTPSPTVEPQGNDAVCWAAVGTGMDAHPCGDWKPCAAHPEPTPTKEEPKPFVSLRGIAPDFPGSPMRERCCLEGTSTACAKHGRCADCEDPISRQVPCPKHGRADHPEVERCKARVYRKPAVREECGRKKPCPDHPEEGR